MTRIDDDDDDGRAAISRLPLRLQLSVVVVAVLVLACAEVASGQPNVDPNQKITIKEFEDSNKPIQDSQIITVTLDPDTEIDSQTNLSIYVQHKGGNYSSFHENDMLSVSRDFDKQFSYAPQSQTVLIQLRKFSAKQIRTGMFVINCVFEPELDEDTHWEVLWISLNSEGQDVPMVTFFVRANIPTEMEIECSEFGIGDCSQLAENDDIMITCAIRRGMPGIDAYLLVPPEANPIVYSKHPRQIRIRAHLTREVRFAKVICGAPGQELVSSRPFEFMLTEVESIKDSEGVLLTLIVSASGIVTIISVVLGIYLVLIKPSKERSKEKVAHNVEAVGDRTNPSTGTLDQKHSSAMTARRISTANKSQY